MDPKEAETLAALCILVMEENGEKWLFMTAYMGFIQEVECHRTEWHRLVHTRNFLLHEQG